MATVFRLRHRINRLFIRFGFGPDWFIIPLAGIIGCLAGLVAVIFEWMVESSSHFFFERVVHLLSANQTTFRLPILVILPMLGGLAVGLMHYYISRAPPGHGIPDVIESLTKRHGILRGRTGIYKAITASLTIGSGGSAGVEGPIVQIGSVLGSQVGQKLRVGHEHMNTLVGCGAAAGLASIFNAPLAGVIFVVEVMLRDFSRKTLTPLIIASVFGVFIVHAIHDNNDQALFMLPAGLKDVHISMMHIGPYIILGLLCGLVGYAFTRSIYAAEHLFHHMKIHPAVKPAIGGALLGLTGICFVLAFKNPVHDYPQPVFYSNGYQVVEALFNPASYFANTQMGPDVARATLLFLVVAFVGKLLGTSLTLGSGGSGGIFAPSLFMGATLGGAFGVLLQQVPFFHDVTPAAFAIAGMAGVLAGTVHCPLAALLLVFEITRDYKFILPVMLVSILATSIAQVLLRDSIYTLALRERGIRYGSMSDLTVLRRMEAGNVPLTPAVLVTPMDPAQRLIDLAAEYSVSDYVVVDTDNHYQGMVVGEDVRTTLLEREAIPLMVVEELMRSDLPTVHREETLEIVLDKFSRFDVSSLAVVDEDKSVTGMITRSALIRHYQNALEETG